MPEVMGSSIQREITDREIAEDLLATQKHLLNYYYAPAILEAADQGLRSAFQEIHADAANAAKSIFDYLHSRGWYQVRMADQDTLASLRNAVLQSRQAVNSSLSTGGNSMQQGQTGWTGTQFMEGQSGMGPSSVARGAQWGGEPSWMTGPTGQFQGGYQGNAPSYARGGFGAQGGSGWQGTTWTGTQYGEGQSGMGPSSLAHGARWGGQPSWTGAGGQTYGTLETQNLPQWTQGSYGGQSSFGAQQGVIGRQAWTGTQYGEGQSGLGPSSVAQTAHWGGEPSWSTGFGGQYGSGQNINLPSWARGGMSAVQGGVGGSGFMPGQIPQGFQQGYAVQNWQSGLREQRGNWQQGSQGNWQSQ
ncbi:MAG TPA: hypothetical protein GX500_06880 [Firmicutes bacterium]|nr:hypothetical protein [Candidatus Fermentithermobacillaceae bacterium]